MPHATPAHGQTTIIAVATHAVVVATRTAIVAEAITYVGMTTPDRRITISINRQAVSVLLLPMTLVQQTNNAVKEIHTFSNSIRNSFFL
jgi:hypothetical protein